MCIMKNLKGVDRDLLNKVKQLYTEEQLATKAEAKAKPKTILTLYWYNLLYPYVGWDFYDIIINVLFWPAKWDMYIFKMFVGIFNWF